jgi:hypothetical protein
VWSAVAGTDPGVECIRAGRQTEDGQAGRVERLQASARHAFQQARNKVRAAAVPTLSPEAHRA